jgi:hypothetical protein
MCGRFTFYRAIKYFFYGFASEYAEQDGEIFVAYHVLYQGLGTAFTPDKILIHLLIHSVRISAIVCTAFTVAGESFVVYAIGSYFIHTTVIRI